MSVTFTDRELLYGILAAQMGLVTREALVEGIKGRTAGEEGLLGDILLRQQAFSPDTKQLVDALVEQHLALHDEDTARSLASLSTVGSLGEELKTLGVPELNAGLDQLTVPHPLLTVPSSPSSADASASDTSEAGRFRVLRMHAKGGIGQVSLAKDGQLSREVALKELQPRYADDPNSRQRFVLEAEVTGGLEHPGVVPVYGAGQYADGRPFYAMRFIRGDSLQDASAEFHRGMGRDPQQVGYELELRKLLRRFIDVCEAMEYAHSRGVLHRDLKPGNIMLGRYGETLVVDWGLAKLADQESDADQSGSVTLLQPASADDSAKTRMGSTIGTPNYMSPEQAGGEIDKLGAASDVYSLGATLYHVLTGQPPFQGDDIGVILAAVQSGAYRRPRETNPRVAKSLEAICLKAMALDTEQRYASAQALADDVERHLADEPVLARPDSLWQSVQRWTRRHRGATLAATAGLVLVALVSAVAFLAVRSERDEAERQRDRAVTSEQEAQQNFRAAEAARALAEEQRELAGSIAYNSTLSEASILLGTDPMMARTLLEHEQRCPPPRRDFLWHVLHNQTVREQRTIPLERAGTYALCYSPQGNTLATSGLNSGDVQLWDTSTGKPSGLISTGLKDVLKVLFSPDGQQLAAISWQEIAGEDHPVIGRSILLLEVWDLATHQLLYKRQREMSGGGSPTFSEEGLILHGFVSESEYARSHPEYERRPESGDNYGPPRDAWYQWVLYDATADTEHSRYLCPTEDTTLQGNFLVGQSLLSSLCTTDSGRYFWLYDYSQQRETVFPVGDVAETDYVPVLSEGSLASFLGMSYREEEISDVDSLALLGTIEFEADISLRQFDSVRQEEARNATLGKFHTGLFIEDERYEFVTLDQTGNRLAMLLDRRPLIQIADLNHPETVRMVPAHLGDVVSAVVSPDGSQVASVGLDSKVRLWDFEQVGRSPSPVIPQVDRPRRLVVSPVDDRLLLFALGPKPSYSSDGSPIYPVAPAPGEDTRIEVTGESNPETPPYFYMETIRVSDGASLAVSKFDDPPEQRQQQPEGLAGLFGAFSVGLGHALAGAFGTHPFSYRGSEAKLTADGTEMLLASGDRLMRFNLEAGTSEELWNSYYPEFKEQEPLRRISVSDDLKLFVTVAMRDGKVRVYDVNSQQVVWQLPAAEGKPFDVRFLPHSQSLLVTREIPDPQRSQPMLRGEVWDVETQQRRPLELPAIEETDSFEFSADGKLLVVHRQFDRQVWVIPLATGEIFAQLNIVRETPLGDAARQRPADAGRRQWTAQLLGHANRPIPMRPANSSG